MVGEKLLKAATLPVYGSLVIWGVVVGDSWVCAIRPPAHVYISVSMYINNTFLSFSRMISPVPWMDITVRYDNSVLIIGTNGRPSLSAFIFVYKGLITKNVYRDEIKWAQTAWKAITCVWVSYCGPWMCVRVCASVCVWTITATCMCVCVCAPLCLHARRKEAYKARFKLPVWEFTLPPRRAEVMMHGVINGRGGFLRVRMATSFGECMSRPLLTLFFFFS